MARALAAFGQWLIWAIVSTVVLAVIAVLWRLGAVEAGLADQAAARLDAAGGFAWSTVSVSGREIRLEGTAPTAEARVAANAAIADLWGATRILDQTVLAPIVAPFVWRVDKRAGANLLLSGHVGSEAVRRELAEAATRANPAARVEDTSEVGRGAPEGFNLAARFALRLAANFVDGTVTLSDSALTASGTAADGLRYDAALDLVAGDLPPGWVIADADVEPPRADPYVWTMRRDGAVALIEGVVPDNAVADAVFAAAQQAMPGGQVEDRTSLASGAPAGFAAAADLAVRVVALLASGALLIDGPSLTVAGRPASLADGEAAAALLASPPPGFTVDMAGLGPAEVSAFTWEAVRTAAGVKLSGQMPSAEAQAEIRAAATEKFGSANLADLSQVAAGEPRMDWIGALDFALGHLALLSEGRVAVAGGDYDIEGVAASPQAYDAIHADLAKTLPASLALGRAEVAPPAVSLYQFELVAEAGQFVMSGHVPGPAARAARLTAVAAALPDAAILDRTLAASGAPADFESAIAAAVPALARLEEPRLTLVDRTVRIAGAAAFAGAAAAIEAEIRAGLPEGFGLTVAIGAPPVSGELPASECQLAAAAHLAEGGIQFRRGDATLLRQSIGLIDRVAATLARCPGAMIEVAGHTDSGGGQRANRDLSRARAEAVVAVLVADGIPAERLTAAGYGEARPIATNRNEEGRIQNRRIEFTLTESADAVRP